MYKKDEECTNCGCTSYDRSLYRSWKNKTDGMYCWQCWHAYCVKNNIKDFGIGVVGENSGFMEDYNFTSAIAESLEKINEDDNIDMGLSIDSAINGSYTATAIVRNYHLYICVAELYNYFEFKDDRKKQIEFLESIVKKLKFQMLNEEDTTE